MTNHASYFDPVFIGAAVNRNLNYMARATLFKPKIVEKFLLSMSAFPVNVGGSDTKAIRWTLELLKSGGVLNIFPEGTRSTDGKLGKALPGVGLIAHKTDAPIVPVYLSGTRLVLPRNVKMPRLAKVRIFFGKPLDMEPYRGIKATREIYNEIGEKIMAGIAELQKISMGSKAQ
jgi:1-acyl-sn-glycerol-3-phosphate acyltransferase